MPGSVYRRSDGYWCASLQVNGKRKTVYARTEKDAKRKLTGLERQVVRVGALPAGSTRTLGHLLDVWLDTTRPT